MTGVPVVVNGRAGRMGDLVAAAVLAAPDLSLRGRLSRRAGPDGSGCGDVRPRLAAFADDAPVVVDLTAPERTRELIAEAAETPCALVIGTSGLDAEDLRRLEDLAARRAVLVSANFSLALRATRRLVRMLAGTAGPDWGAGIVDLHFRGKVDPLSATARALARDWDDHRGPGAPPACAVSFRQGNGVSEHRVIVSGPGEVVEVTHRIESRQALLPGILAAIRFLHGRRPGLYSSEHAA